MATGDTHRLGYHHVDADPNAEVLLSAMDRTAEWEATLRLRSWERTNLALTAGERLLDVGCGLGEAALALAEDLGPGGEVVGVDLSERMLGVARENAAGAPCPARFVVGDAAALGEPDESFDVVRSERTLQWVADPQRAVAEMVRVVRTGGRVSLIDTDWSTFTIEVGDDAISALVHEAMRTERNRPSHVGRRLHELLAAAGCSPVARTEATQTWTAWDPDASSAPLGCFSMESLVDDLVAGGQVAIEDAPRHLSTIREAARHGRFSMSLTMFGVFAIAPKRYPFRWA